MNELIKELKRAINRDKGTTAYDTDAEVIRTEGTIAWVHIPGGVEETPVNMSITAKPGDQVRVRVANTGAYLIGNMTAPPTDDYLATTAKSSAEKAGKLAEQAVEAAKKQKQYVWKDEEGIHVSREKTIRENTNNILIDSDSVDIRAGKSVLTSFGERIILGVKEKMRSIFSSNKIEMVDSNDNKVFSINGLDMNRSISEHYSNQDFSFCKKVPTEEIYNFLRNGHELQLETLYDVKNIESISIAFAGDGESDFSDKVNWSIDTANSKLVKLQRKELSSVPVNRFFYLKIIYKSDKSSTSVGIGSNLSNPQNYLLCVGGNGTKSNPKNNFTVDYDGNANFESVFVKNDIKLFYDIDDFITINSITSNGFITSSKTEILFTIPLTKPFVSSVTKIHFHNLTIKVRQNGKYLIGTGSKSVNIMNFADYEVTAIPTEQGIKMVIKMKLGPLTDAANNDTLAVWIEDASAVCVKE